MVKERLSSAKELAFIADYQGHGDGARAARDAGYSPKGAERMAWELLNQPAVRDRRSTRGALSWVSDDDEVFMTPCRTASRARYQGVR